MRTLLFYIFNMNPVSLRISLHLKNSSNFLFRSFRSLSVLHSYHLLLFSNLNLQKAPSTVFIFAWNTFKKFYNKIQNCYNMLYHNNKTTGFPPRSISNCLWLKVPKSALLKIFMVSHPDSFLANMPSALPDSLLRNYELLDLEMMQQILMGGAYA